jgi:hypothetical protein
MFIYITKEKFIEMAQSGTAKANTQYHIVEKMTLKMKLANAYEIAKAKAKAIKNKIVNIYKAVKETTQKIVKNINEKIVETKSGQMIFQILNIIGIFIITPLLLKSVYISITTNILPAIAMGNNLAFIGLALELSMVAIAIVAIHRGYLLIRYGTATNYILEMVRN